MTHTQSNIWLVLKAQRPAFRHYCVLSVSGTQTCLDERGKSVQNLFQIDKGTGVPAKILTSRTQDKTTLYIDR